LTLLKFLNPIFKRININASKEHLATMEAMVNTLETLDSDTAAMKLELMILTATGKWLDTWGDWFGCVRLHDEVDELYSKRIIATTVSPKNTMGAIIGAVNEVIGYDGTYTKVVEPHTIIARHNVSEFSGEHKYQSGTYYRSGVVDIQVPRYAITDSLRDAIEKVRAAGVRFYFTNYLELVSRDDEIVILISENAPEIEYTSSVQLVVNDADILTRSGSYSFGIRSGKQTIFFGEIKETYISTDAYIYKADYTESLVTSDVERANYIFSVYNMNNISESNIGKVTAEEFKPINADNITEVYLDATLSLTSVVTANSLLVINDILDKTIEEVADNTEFMQLGVESNTVTAVAGIPIAIRYIRDWTNGNTGSVGATNSHWAEIMAIDKNGVNVALGKTATFSPADGTWNPGYVTDGIINVESNYSQTNSTIIQPLFAKIDLGSLYELDRINVRHYYHDARTYHGTKTEVSSDGVTWYTVFDSKTSGEYTETSSGKTHLL